MARPPVPTAIAPGPGPRVMRRPALTPIGYQTNVFVYAPGGYRFTDFTRVGAPLGLLIAAAATFVIPLFFPFQ